MVVKRRPVAGLVTAVIFWGLITTVGGQAGGYIRASPVLARGPTSAMDSTPVRLDADLYLPSTTPAPAVVLAHGFGGSKASVATDEYRQRGFVVWLTPHEDSAVLPDHLHELAGLRDRRRLGVDYLATLDSVTQDGASDLIGFAGGSYVGRCLSWLPVTTIE